jgi:hypothetical protein
MSIPSAEISSRIETLRCHIESIQARCANLEILERKCNDPTVSERSIQVGDVVEGDRYPDGLVLKIESREGYTIAHVFTAKLGIIQSCPLEELRHATSNTLDNVAFSAASTYRESLKTLTKFETELSTLASTH